MMHWLKRWRPQRIKGATSLVRGLLVLGRSLLLLGIGWALTSTCPGGGGPMATPSVLIAATVAGLWTFNVLRTRLPR